MVYLMLRPILQINKNFETSVRGKLVGLCRCICVSSSQLFCEKSSYSPQKYIKNIDGMVDVAVPNEQWSKDSLKLFNKLSELTAQGTGWMKVKLASQEAEESKLFLKAVDEKGKFLEYAFFVNPTLKCLKGVVQFGKHTRGAKGIVHGGATATILDAAMGLCVHYSGFRSLTGNLNVNYKRPLPIDTTVSVEANIDKVEGRKVFTSATMKTVDGEEIYSTATALFVMLSNKI